MLASVLMSFTALGPSSPGAEPAPIGDDLMAERPLPRGTVLDLPPPETPVLIDSADTWAVCHKDTLGKCILWRDEAAACADVDDPITLVGALPWLIVTFVAVAAVAAVAGGFAGAEIEAARRP